MRRFGAVAVFLVALFLPAIAKATTIAGAVTPIQWAQEVKVCLVEVEPSETCTVPQANGSYALTGIGFGTVQVEFVPSFRSRLAKQYWNHKSRLSEATPIVISPTSPPVIQSINADLVEGGAIEGTVTALGGGGQLAQVEVCAISNFSPTVRVCGETDSTGGYELHSLPAGSYAVGFWGAGASAVYQSSYYQGKSSLAQSTPVVVGSGETVAGVDAALAKGGEISGLVTSAAGGLPLEGIGVCLFTPAGPTAQRCVATGAGGAYAFPGLSDGSYQVGFSLTAAEIGGGVAGGEGDGFESQFYAGAGGRATATAIAVQSPNVVGGIDASLRTPPAPPGIVFTPAAPLPTVAPVVVTEPKPKQAGCKKPRRKKKVKGKVRCVKPANQKHKKKSKATKKKHSKAG